MIGAPGTNGEGAEPIEGDGTVRWLVVETTGSRGPDRAGPARPPQAVDINGAPVEELIRLPGVDRGAAERIVSERERNGPFESVTDLKRVEGFDDLRLRRVWEHTKIS